MFERIVSQTHLHLDQMVRNTVEETQERTHARRTKETAQQSVNCQACHYVKQDHSLTPYSQLPAISEKS
jgi:hypothetical protein